jgi:hypothetical protein
MRAIAMAVVVVKAEEYDGTYECVICSESVRGEPALKCAQCNANPVHVACVDGSIYAEACSVCKREMMKPFGSSRREAGTEARAPRARRMWGASTDKRALRGSEVSSGPGTAGKKRRAPAEPEDGDGAAERQPHGGWGMAATPGARRKEPSKCPHNRRRAQCKECGGSSICPHQRRRSQCKDCGGASICSHQRIRSTCKECGGASICPHQRQRSLCKECGGTSICPHQRRRSQCKECGGASICPHQRIRSRCKECGVGGKRPVNVVEAEQGGGSAKKQRRVKLQATLPTH